MQKSILLTLTLIALAATSVIISSCSKDDEKPSPAELTFFDDDMTVDENDGTIEVRIVLNKAFSQPIAIDYDVEGSAIEGSSASSDYEINGSFGEVVIEAGETEAFIEIDINDDNLYEGNETIELSIDDVNSEDIIIGDADNVTITLEDNDEQPTVSFSGITTVTMDETEASLEGHITEIEVTLDAPAASDVVVRYELGGTAVDSLLVFALEGPERYYDYAVNSESASYSSSSETTSGEVVIPAGETSANIELRIWSDFVFENDETIIITLESSEDATIGTNDEYQINLLQEDGRGVFLLWDFTKDIDMDMFLWVLNEEGEHIGRLDIVANGGTDDWEVTFLPAWILDEEGKLGLSYTYYSGTIEPMDFGVVFADYADGDLEPEDDQELYEATYTLDNLNPWDTNEGFFPPPVAQSFDITDGQYTNISDITVADEFSRRPAVQLTQTTTSLMKKMMRPNINTERAKATTAFKTQSRSAKGKLLLP
ncbi:MAG TPA: Calx-beta domain-containing protein [Ohtaekwangia sp.]